MLSAKHAKLSHLRDLELFDFLKEGCDVRRIFLLLLLQLVEFPYEIMHLLQFCTLSQYLLFVAFKVRVFFALATLFWSIRTTPRQIVGEPSQRAL
jgi:hypothetical protein